jgi:phosphatidylglycerol:prolipoprotein diacylglycerol transferase
MNVYPLVFRIGSFDVTGFGIMMMFAFLVAGWIGGLELRRYRLNENYAGDIVVAAVIGGIVGAKLWYVVLTRDMGALLSRGGLVWYGGFLGGVVAVLINGWRLKVPARWTMQLTGPALAAAYAVGRIGCLVVGDDYGGPSSLPWAMKFPEGLPPSTVANLQRFGVRVPEGLDPSTVLAVHPTQVYETLLMTLAFAWLWSIRRKPGGTGWLFGVYLMLAGTERFLVEILRAKDDRFLGPLTVAQVASILVVAAGALVYASLRGAKGEVDPGEYLRRTEHGGRTTRPAGRKS